MTGEENQAKKIDYSTIFEFASIKFCPSGKCVVDINSGSKRCPDGNDKKLTYYPTLEGCTDRDSCDDERIPYAVKSNGEANTRLCDSGETCRCVAKPQCADYIVSTFDITNGNPYSTDNTELNYYFTINSNGKDVYSKKSISYNQDELGNKFCKINPAFTDRITNGCNFKNSLYDPVDCENSYLFQNIEDDNNSVSILPSNYDKFTVSNCKLADKNFKGYLIGSNFLYVASINPVNIKNKGFLDFTINGTNYTIYYSGLETFTFCENCIAQGEPGPGSIYTGYKLKNIYGREDDENNSETFNFRPGLPVNIEIEGKGDDNILENDDTRLKLVPRNIVYQPCTNNITGPNYKNMLTCIQKDEQPCIEGFLTYDVDKILNNNTSIFNQNNSRSFCLAESSERLDINNARKYYLNDPAYFTTSCIKGIGCGEDFDTNLCIDDNCNEAVKERKKNFFDNYDASAVSSIWEIPYDGLKNRVYFDIIGVNRPQLELKNPDSAMFDIDNGDYWSIINPDINKFLRSTAELDDKELFLNSISEINIGASISYPGVNSTLPGIIEINKTQKSITLDKSIGISLPVDTNLKITDFVGDNYGILGKIKDSVYLMDFDGNNYATLEINKIKERGIFIYKQFGFNGINYNTSFKVDKDNFSYRIYSPSFIYYSNLISKTTGPVVDYKSLPISPEISSDKRQNSNIAFNDPTAVFKNKKSMYYPVWNKAVYKQECIMCKPSFFAYTSLSADNTVNGINIQFSGQHFFNYITEGINEEFVYSTFTKIKSGSNTNYLIMEDLNENISIGDYVIDSVGFLEREFKITNGNNSADNIILSGIKNYKKKTPVLSITPNNLYQNFILVDKIGQIIEFNPSTGSVLEKLSNQNYINNYLSPPVNYFAGKIYTDDKNNDYLIVPVIKIIDKLEINGQYILLTDSGINLKYDKDFFIQTIKMEETLEISIEQDVLQKQEAIGKGAAARVDEISKGRITNLEILNSGTNYSIENRPGVFLTKYYFSEEINNLIQ